MDTELIYGRILTEQEKTRVAGGVCITTFTVSGPTDAMTTDDSSSSGPSCPDEEILA